MILRKASLPNDGALGSQSKGKAYPPTAGVPEGFLLMT